jgi:inner membrane protein
MDNLTHSLVGALIGQIGLKRKTGLAMPTLIIAANIPDIDAVATLLGGHQHLAIRRGITHGPIAMLVLPLLLWGIMLWFDRWQAGRGKRPEKRLPVHKGWLLALAYIGCLSHPLFDWFNSYGIRLLEPFSSRWFYGDTLFIIDVWIWVALIAGVWLSLRRERSEVRNWQRPAWICFTFICVYVFANGLITREAERRAMTLVERAYQIKPTLVVANPIPVKFWQRELLWRYQPAESTNFVFGRGDFSVFHQARLVFWQNTIGGGYEVVITEQDLGREEDRKWIASASRVPVDRLVKANDDLRAFLFWSRMPVFEVQGKADGKYILEVSDQRFQNTLTRNRFVVSVACKVRCE